MAIVCIIRIESSAILITLLIKLHIKWMNLNFQYCFTAELQPLKNVLFLSSVFSRAECIDNPPVLLNSIDASFQVRLQELEEKQEVQ